MSEMSERGWIVKEAEQEAGYSQNLPLLFLIATIPLQNIYLAKLPTLGPGLNYLNIMVLLSAFVWRFRQDLSESTPGSLNKPILFFILIYIFSYFHSFVAFGGIPEGNANAVKDIIIGIVLYYITLNSVRDQKGIAYVLAATVLPIPYMFYVFRNQLYSVASFHYDDDMRLVSGTFMELGSNEFAAFFAGYLLILIAVLILVKNLIVRIALAGVIMLGLYCLMYSYSRGSWMSFVAGLMAVFFLKSKKSMIIVLLSAAVFGGGVYSMLPISVQERFDTIFVEEESRDDSAASRFVLWELAFDEFKKSPIVGIGYRVFSYVNTYENKDTHNYFVKILTEQGIIGILLLVTILVRALIMSRKLYVRAVNPLYKALGMGAFGMLVAFILGNVFGDRFSHYPLIAYFWVYLALVQRALILEQDEAPVISETIKS